MLNILILASTPLYSFAASTNTSLPVDLHATRIEPGTIRYGKETEITITLEKNTAITHAFLSPGGPYTENITNILLPSPDNIKDVLLSRDNTIIASANGEIISLDSTGKTPDISSKTKLGSAVIKLAANQTSIFAITQSGELFSLDHASLAIKNKTTVNGIITDMTADNGHLYLLQEQKILLIFDIRGPSAPRLKAKHKLNHKAVKLSASNGYCFLATEKNGIIVLNTNNTSKIKQADHFITSGSALDIVVRGNLAYVADGLTGLSILDISNPENIVFLGSNNKTGYTNKLSLGNNRILTSNLQNRLYLIDISRPESPVILSTYQADKQIKHLAYREKSALIVTKENITSLNLSAEITPPINTEGVTLGGSRRGDIKDNLLYVADWFSGLHIYDISHPSAIKHVSGYHTKGSSKGIIVRGHYAFVGDDDHGLQIIDVKDPTQPQLISELPTTGLAYTLKLIDDVLYLADHRGGFHIISIRDIKHPKRLGGVDTPGKAWAIDVKDNIAYIADDSTGLLVFDVSSPENPVLIGQFNPGGFAEDIKIRNNIAFVTFFDKGLYILDISTPEQPELISHLAIPGNARGIELDGDTAYIAAWYAGLQIVDIKDLSNPVIVGYYDTDGATWGTNKKDNIIYALDWWGGIKTIDVKNKRQPILVSQYHAKETIRRLATKGNYTYTTNGQSGLQIYDTRNALNPMWIAGLELPGESTLISIHENFCFVTSDHTVSVIDIRDPFQTRLVTTINITGEISSLQINKNFAFVLDKDRTLTTFDISDPGTPIKIHTAKMQGDKLWIGNQQLISANQNKSLFIYDINNNGQTNFRSKYILAENVKTIRFLNNALFISTGDQHIRVLTKNGNTFKQTAAIDIKENLIDIKISADTLYATTEHSDLLAFTITKENKLKFNNKYTSSNRVSYFQVNKDQVFFAGAKRLSTLTLLPDIASQKTGKTTLSLVVPKNMPLGQYNLMLEDKTKNIFTLPGTISVELPNFRKPQFKKSH